MHTGDTYKVLFTGEINPDSNKETVVKNLSRLFGVLASEILPIFEGEVIFQRSGLNKMTAELYLSRLNKTGALCYLEKEHKPESNFIPSINNQHEVARASDRVESKNTCPRCKSTNIGVKKCRDCGIYFEKYKNNTVDVISVSTPVEDDPDALEIKRKATLIIKYAVYYLIAVFMFDSYIDNNRESLKYVLSPDFRVGFIPYLLGNIVLAYGCYYLAILKGRSGYWGLLGLASVPGMCVLLLLSDENNKSIKPNTKIQVFSYTIIVISLIWFGSKLFLAGGEVDFVTRKLVLREQRHEYPSTNIDSRAGIYESEIDELNKYLDEGFALLDKHDFDYFQVKAITDAMFSETMRVYVWINYQRYLQFRNGAVGVKFLERDNIRKFQMATFSGILDRTQRLGQAKVDKALGKWFMGSGTSYEESMYLSSFLTDEFTIREKIRRASYRKKITFDPPIPIFTGIEIPEFSHSIIKKRVVEDGKINFTFAKSPYASSGQTLVLAYYFDFHQSYSTSMRRLVDRPSLQTVLISPDFPTYLLVGDLSVFPGADIFPLMDKLHR